MKQQNSRETQARGMRELEAINGEKGKLWVYLPIHSYRPPTNDPARPSAE